MSSSRVIKACGMSDHAISDFLFRGLSDRVQGDAVIEPEEGFVPYGDLKNVAAPLVSQSVSGGESECAALAEDTRVAEMETQLRVVEEEAVTRVKEAYEKGLEEGQRLAERGLSNVFRSLREAVDEVISLRDHVIHECEEDLLKLSVLVAGTIIRQEIAQDRNILAKVVAIALENSKEHDEIVIRLNPEDYKLVSSHKQNYLQGIGDRRSLNLRPDDTISSGGCIVDTVMGEVDARLETQLDEIYRHMLEERGEIIGLTRNIRADGEQYAYEES